MAPDLLTLPGVGPEVAGQPLTSADDNPGWITSEAAFAPCAASRRSRPAAAASTATGSTAAATATPTTALYIVVLNRLRYDPRSRAYAQRRTQEGLSKPEIIRCLKRYVAREIYRVLVPALAAKTRCAQPVDNGSEHRSANDVLRTTVGHCVRLYEGDDQIPEVGIEGHVAETCTSRR